MIKDRNKIIKNVYYMISYAFQSLNLKDIDDKKVEEFDEMYDLFGAILSKGIGTLLKHGVHKEYTVIQDDIAFARGKINVYESYKNKLEGKRVINCSYDELTENNIYNKILKTTAMLLIKNSKVKSDIKDELKSKLLFFSNVETLDPLNIKWSTIIFQRNNRIYQFLISICQLVIKGLLITTESGDYEIKKGIELEEYTMSRLYEKFILEYYSRHWPMLNANALHIKWAIDDDEKTMLPEMKSDVYLKKDKTVLIIDAKYYSHATIKNYDKETVKSGNIYQIFTYVKNADYELEGSAHKVSGMLLYAKTEDEIQPDNRYKMHGNDIYVKTLDLNCDFLNDEGIADQLDNIVIDYFDLNKKDKK